MKQDIALDITIPNQTRYLSLIGKIGENMARELDRFPGDREALANHLNLVLTEALVNAIKHANAADPAKEVHIRINVSATELTICVYDSGKGFDIDTVKLPSFNLDALQDKGRGIFIIKSLMDSVEYRKTKCGNVLEMKKRLV